MRNSLQRGFRIVQLDEMMYTKSTFGTHEYSKKNCNMQVDLSKTNTEAIAVIVAISRERGVEHMM